MEELKVDFADLDLANSKNIVEERLEDFKFPYFIEEYFANNLSPKTKEKRIYSIRSFLEWLITNNIVQARKIGDITLDDFSKISTDDVEQYWKFLLEEPKKNKHNDKIIAEIERTNDKKKKRLYESQLDRRSQRSVNTLIAANKSLFNYLKKKALKKGGDEAYAGFKISPWEGAEPPVYQERENVATQRAKIMDQMFDRDELDELFDFMRNEYPKKYDGLKNGKNFKKRYDQNIERNIALIALLDYSGVRISEALSISLEQLDLDNLVIKDVKRKENVRTNVNLQKSVVKYLEDYLAVRKARYLDKQLPGYDDPFVYNALFLSEKDGKVGRFTPMGAWQMINEITQSFGKKTTPHKFRHSFTNDLVDAGAKVTDIQQALGQTTSSATEVYMHSDDKKQRELYDKADKL